MNEAVVASDHPLHIAYLFQQFPIPTETFAVSDIAALIAQGHHVSVYTLKPPRRDEAALAEHCGVPRNLPVYRPGWTGVRAWPRLLWHRRRQAGWLVRKILPHWRTAPLLCLETLLCIPRLIEITDHLSATGSDVVHAFWSRHVALVLPLLMTEDSPCARTAFVGAYDLVADDFLLDIIVPAADILFSHAQTNRPALERRAGPGQRIAIIHRGIPLMEIVDDQRDPFRLITASALVASKNVGAVIKSFDAARKAEDRLTLSIYGDGEDRHRLQRIAEELGCASSMTLAGHVTRDALFRELQRAGVFILLSKKPSERLPNVVKEALWAGCAVISSASEGIEELLPDPGLGFIVDPDDPEAIAAALCRVIAERPDEGRRRRDRARAFIADHFSSDASMRAYVRVWRGELGLRGAAGVRIGGGSSQA